jgi:8-oxo-dGTP diphosphatase
VRSPRAHAVQRDLPHALRRWGTQGPFGILDLLLIFASERPAESDLAPRALAPLASSAVCENDRVALTQTCLCLLTRVVGDDERQVLLGYKKTGLGTGKIVALGGHVEERETAAQAAAREVKEESGIAVAAGSLREAAHITFLFPTRPAWDMTVAVFISGAWSGEPAETEEIRPQWFPVAALPFDRMWDDGKYWLTRVLAGERLLATFKYAPDCETVAESELAPLG